MDIPKDKSKRRRKEKLKEKHCLFPMSDDETCGKLFFGTGKSKYCPEHRKRKYRVIIDKRAQRNKSTVKIEDSGNQYIEHNYTDPQTYIFQCALEGCYEEFKVTILPNQKVYPKYCLNHRNAYKRKLHTERYEANKVQAETVS